MTSNVVPLQQNFYCTMYTVNVQCTMYGVQCTLYSRSYAVECRGTTLIYVYTNKVYIKCAIIYKVYSVQCTLYTVHTVYIICTLYTFSVYMFRITMTLTCTISIGKVFNSVLNFISVSSVLMYNKCYNQGCKSRGDGGYIPLIFDLHPPQ